MKLRALFVREESGQELVESALFIALMFIFVVFALNFSYFIGFIHTVHASSAQAASYSAQGDLTPTGAASGQLPESGNVSMVAKNEINNSLRDTKQTSATVSVCQAASGGGCGFTDPEDPGNGVANAGTFSANSVTVSQPFTPFWGSGSKVTGVALVPFTTTTPVSHTVYMRALQ